MDDLWSVKRFARWKYETDTPTENQVKTVIRMCHDGKLPAIKIGREWRIDTAQILERVRNGNKKSGAA